MKTREILSIRAESNGEKYIQFCKVEEAEEQNISFEFYHPECDFVIESVMNGIDFVLNIGDLEKKKELLYYLEYLPEDADEAFIREAEERIADYANADNYHLHKPFIKEASEHLFWTAVDLIRKRIDFYSEAAGLNEYGQPQLLLSYTFDEIEKHREKYVSRYRLVEFFNKEVAEQVVSYIVEGEMEHTPEYSYIVLEQEDDHLEASSKEGIGNNAVHTIYDIDEETEVMLMRWTNYLVHDPFANGKYEDSLVYIIPNRTL